MARTKATELSPRQAAFVRHYLVSGNGAQAARRAGYSSQRAGDRAYRLLRMPQIEAAVAEARAKALEGAAYGLQEALAEADRLLLAAEAAGQFIAAGRMAELKAKLSGLMVEKIEHQGVGFVLNIVGLGSPNALPGEKDVTPQDDALPAAQGSEGRSTEPDGLSEGINRGDDAIY